jgi:hypothetical protein
MARSLSGYATQIDPISDIVCAYTTSPTQLPARSGAYPPIVIGEFTVPSAVTARLTVCAFLSEYNSLVDLNVWLYNPARIEASHVHFIETRPTIKRSEPLNLVPSVLYQVVAAVEGLEGPTRFAVVRHAYLGAP